MADKKIYQICPTCKGEKTVTVSINHNGDPPIFGPELETITCVDCSGLGFKEWGYMEK